MSIPDDIQKVIEITMTNEPASLEYASIITVDATNILRDADIGVTVQAHDSALDSLAGLTTTADKGVYTTAPDTYATFTLTAAGRALLDDASAAEQRATLGLGAIATQDNVNYSQLIGTVPTWNQSTTGNAATATKLATARTINGVAFDGSGNIVVTATDPTYTSADVKTKLLTVDGAGSGIDADLLDGQQGSYYQAWGNVTGKPTTLSGYGITDAAPSSHVGSGGTAHANASTTNSGFMAATDKSKLDGIAPGATANTGTVTSVAVANAIGITWTGGPITSAGTLTPTLSANLQAWSGIAPYEARAPRVQVISDTNSGSVTCDWGAYDEIRVTLTANTTFTFTGALNGQRCILKLKQDYVGEHTVTLPGDVRYNDGITSYAVTMSAGNADKVGFVYDGTDYCYDIVSVVRGIDWDPSTLFSDGSQGAWYDLTSISTMYQDSAGTLPVTATGQPVGLIRDKSGRGNNASQTTTTKRPIATQLNNRYTLLGDNVDDILTAPNTVDGDLLWASPYGWMRSEVSSGTVNLPLAGMNQAVLHSPLTQAQLNQVGSYFGVPQQYIVMVTRATVLNNLRCYTGGGTTVLTAIGSNGVTATLSLSTNANVSWDLGAAGLTMPATVLVPSLSANNALTHFYYNGNQLTGNIPSLSANTALQSLQCYSNQLTGSIPSLSANTALTYFTCYSNQLTGSIPSLSANTALTYFACNSNQLTGSIPNLSANTALYYFNCSLAKLTGSIPNLSANTALQTAYFNNNQLTGSIPSLSTNTALTLFRCDSNQLTDYAGGSVSNTLGTFYANNNNLTATAVNALLASFVAAGRTSANGTCILNLGGTGNAAPTGQGLTDKATLISRGWTVTTN